MFHVNNLTDFRRDRVDPARYHRFLFGPANQSHDDGQEGWCSCVFAYVKGVHWPQWWGPQVILYLGEQGELVSRTLDTFTREEFRALPASTAEGNTVAGLAERGVNPFWCVAIADDDARWVTDEHGTRSVQLNRDAQDMTPAPPPLVLTGTTLTSASTWILLPGDTEWMAMKARHTKTRSLKARYERFAALARQTGQP